MSSQLKSASSGFWTNLTIPLTFGIFSSLVTVPYCAACVILNPNYPSLSPGKWWFRLGCELTLLVLWILTFAYMQMGKGINFHRVLEAPPERVWRAATFVAIVEGCVQSLYTFWEFFPG